MLLQKLNCQIDDLGENKLEKALANISVEEMAEELGVGDFTLQDIIASLVKPSRDPRDELSAPLLYGIRRIGSKCTGLWRLY